MFRFPTHLPIALTAVAALAAAACSHGAGSMLPTESAATSASMQGTQSPDSDVSILKMLTKQVVIGSTIDPKFGQLNPYGLTVAPITSGKYTQGDLVVCNFNDKNNVQGTGFTVVALHPKPGSKPVLVSSSKTLVGCDALALGPFDDIWAAAFTANDNPVISAQDSIEYNLKGKPYDRPWGQIFAQPKTGSPAFYEGNAGDGTVVRIDALTFTAEVIATGFAVNHGKPGSIFAPSGFAYNPAGDILYVVDGANNTVVAFDDVTKISKDGIIVEPGGKTFKGPSAKHAHLIFAGAPLNGPISSALLFNGNLVVGNTGNPSGKNIMVELSPKGKVLDTANVDKGAAGALFGMVATGTSAADTRLYFNDDNDNNLQVLEQP
jgi:DNA-binding beta-propeller fold protein YncE